MLLLIACTPEYNQHSFGEGTSPVDTGDIVEQIDTGDTAETETRSPGIPERLEQWPDTGAVDTGDTGDTGEPPTVVCPFVLTVDGNEELQAQELLPGGGLGAPIGVGVVGAHPVIGDFDNDGDLEALAWVDEQLALLDGDFCAGDVEVEPMDRDFVPRAAGDLNDDGWLDVAGWTESGQGVVGLGSASGFGWRNVDVSSALSHYFSMAAYRMADVTGDGHADLVIASYDGYAADDTWISVLAGDGSGGLGAPTSAGGFAEPSNGADLGDLDGDGRTDLIIGLDDDGDAGQIYVLWGTSSGLGTPTEYLDIQPTHEDGTNRPGQGTLRLVDVDRDADLDALVLHRPTSDFKTTTLDRFDNTGGSLGSPQAELSRDAVGASLTLAVPVSR